MDGLCRTDTGQVAVALIGKHETVGPQTLNSCSQSWCTTVGSLLPVDVDIAIGKDCAAHR